MSWISDLINVLLPMRCAVCDDEAGYGDLPHLCARCARLVPGHVWPLRSRIQGIGEGWGLCAYAGVGGLLVRSGKYGRREDLLCRLGARLAVAAAGALPVFDAVVPAPSPWSRVVGRGFSAPWIFGDAVARALGIPCVRVLGRRSGRRQAGLSREERWANVEGGVFLHRTFKEDSRLLLVDDVVTTGATAGTCAQVLLEAGARRVGLLVLASALP